MPASIVFRHLLLLFFFTVFSFALQAQLCTGSLGDPVVNITFNGSSGAAATAPGYMYTSSSCPNDGFYTVTSSSSSCFGNTWHTVTSDHTGNGSFMLVNASFTPGDFFVTSVTDLCPNTTYEFASWIMNVMMPNGIKPNITFKIETPDGTVLQQFGTGDIQQSTSPLWKQYGFYFTTPANNATIVLRMTNNAPGGYGNDLGLDDITFRPCGAPIYAGITGYPDTVDICVGSAEVFTMTADVSSLYQSPVYQWQQSTDKGTTWTDIAGAVTASYTRMPTGAGSYWYRLAVVEAQYAGLISCRIASNGLVITVHPNPIVNAGPDRISIAGDSIRIAAEAEGEAITFSWTPDIYINDFTQLKPTVSPPHEMLYTLSAESAFGCTNQDDVFIKVVAGIFVPTAFTPNNDRKNDTWEIPFLDPAFEGTVSVFNRAGRRVYHTESKIVSWDGNYKGMPQPAGAYVYLVTFKTRALKLKGTVMLIR